MTDDASDPITSPAYDNVVHVTPEAWIAQRATQRKPTWYLLRLGDQWPRCSLKTTDLRQATALALKAYQAWLEDPNGDWRAASGNTSHHIGFKTVAEEWLKTQKKDHAYKDDVLRKFLLPYFDQEQHVASMTMIDQAMIDDYKVWRTSFWLSATGNEAREKTKVSDKQAGNYREPNPNTLNREYPTLRQILLYAGKRGYFGKQAMPNVPAEKASANPRPAFLGNDFPVLMAEADKWIKEAEDKPTRNERQLLADWIWVVRYTGLRVPHEAEKLTWADVRLDVNLLYVPPDTKTGKREVPLRDEAAKRLTAMKKRREAVLKRPVSGDDVLFALPNGERSKKLGQMFNALIARCKFTTRADQLSYSPYGLRATFSYATCHHDALSCPLADRLRPADGERLGSGGRSASAQARSQRGSGTSSPKMTPPPPANASVPQLRPCARWKPSWPPSCVSTRTKSLYRKSALLLPEELQAEPRNYGKPVRPRTNWLKYRVLSAEVLTAKQIPPTFLSCDAPDNTNCIKLPSAWQPGDVRIKITSRECQGKKCSHEEGDDRGSVLRRVGNEWKVVLMRPFVNRIDNIDGKPFERR